jgi:hypothetical protein
MEFFAAAIALVAGMLLGIIRQYCGMDQEVHAKE